LRYAEDMTGTHQGLRERKNERTRVAITRAALELALDLGVERTTVAQIAERADVSPRTVHAWFPSKDDIFVVGADLPKDRLAAELKDGEGDLIDRVRRWVEAEGDSRPEPEDVARLRHRVLLTDPHLRALQRARQQDVEDLIAAAIAAGNDLPRDAIAPKALAAAIVTTLLALQERFVAHGHSQEADHFGGASEMLRAALTALHARADIPDR
jgi:AcrR family transcriptional regulator